jgi:hypothetical protein
MPKLLELLWPNFAILSSYSTSAREPEQMQRNNILAALEYTHWKSMVRKARPSYRS